MTRINKTTNITPSVKPSMTRGSNNAVKSNSSSKSRQPISVKQLERKIQRIISKKALSADEVRETVISQIILWQFGDSALADTRISPAYKKLIAMVKDSETYQSLINQFLMDK